jgi:hypothetical protein
MSFIPSDQPLRWLVGKQDMISRKQGSVSAKSPMHSANAVAEKFSRFWSSGRMTDDPHLTLVGRSGITEGLPTNHPEPCQ